MPTKGLDDPEPQAATDAAPVLEARAALAAVSRTFAKVGTCPPAATAPPAWPADTQEVEQWAPPSLAPRLQGVL